MHISTATDDIPTTADMAPTTAPLPPSTSPRRDGKPPRLPSLPTSLVPIEGRLVRHRPETHADQVSRLRGPTTAVAAPSRAVRSGGERQQRQTSTLKSMSSRPIDALFDEVRFSAIFLQISARSPMMEKIEKCHFPHMFRSTRSHKCFPTAAGTRRQRLVGRQAATPPPAPPFPGPQLHPAQVGAHPARAHLGDADGRCACRCCRLRRCHRRR